MGGLKGVIFMADGPERLISSMNTGEGGGGPGGGDGVDTIQTTGPMNSPSGGGVGFSITYGRRTSSP